jgi:hypothetical protein
MLITTLRTATMMTVVAIGSLLWATDMEGAEFFIHRGRRCNKGLIEPHSYKMYDTMQSASIIAIASADQPESISQFARSVKSPGNRETVEIERKLFPVNVNSITAGGVTLERMGLTLYADGRYICTGLLSFDGGPQAALLGANVAVRIRAYSGTPLQEGNALNMRMLWETRRKAFVRRDEPLACSLLPDFDLQPLLGSCEGEKFAPIPNKQPITVTSKYDWPDHPSDLILLHFEETTHLEIILERYTDR